jgi:hypothetical protein
MGDRPDGVAEASRASDLRHHDPVIASFGRQASTSPCGPRLLSPGQLHLRLRNDEDEPALRYSAELAQVAQYMRTLGS